MATSYARLISGTSMSLLMSFGLIMADGLIAGRGEAQELDENTLILDTIVISAEDQVKQSLGASNISAEDIAKRPPANDIAEIVRKMPGVNLTGNTVSGQRGNNRQIDIRGMGPENTLILIDGKPVTSRNAVRMGRQGERDTRGDSNWVPAELVERIEVIRGPAAARYGSGASGGVVNIITKRPDTFTGSIGLHTNLPSNDLEGSSARTNFMLAGPASESLTFRLFGNYGQSNPDDPDLNYDPTQPVAEGEEPAAPAGREGVVNKDIGALLSWNPTAGHVIDFEAGFSRQGNRFAGDRQTGSSILDEVDGVNLIGVETNRMIRRTLSATHRGEYDFGSSFSYLQWEGTANTRLGEGTAGSGEGNINSLDRSTLNYDSISAKSEWNLPMQLAGRDSNVTLGGEIRAEKMAGREFESGEHDSQNLLGLYAEANILWNDKLTLTPGLRYDHSDTFGGNASPSLNATYAFTDEWSMKLGLARAFKAPNLFQLNPDYVYSTMGMGCPAGVATPCMIMGNADLKAEHSFNKEIGVAYEGFNGISASLTYFDNDYKNRIAADMETTFPNPETGGSILQWGNIPEAVIRGVEGNFSTEFADGEYALNVNFTKMVESLNKRTGNPLSLVPEHTINASIDWYARDDLVVTLAATHYGEIQPASRTLSTNLPIPGEEQVARDPYTLVDISMKWDFADTASVSAGITNLFDKQIKRTSTGASDANTFNEPGRAVYLSLNKTF